MTFPALPSIVRLNGALARLVNATPRLALSAALALAVPAAAPAAVHAAEPIRILALGDSLTAGYGLAPQDAFTGQLERALQDRGYDVEVLDAGVSGDTTAGGLARLDWALTDDPDMVLVELGANDALRGIDPAEARRNLAAILERLTEAGLPTLLAGMYAPRNYGADYAEAFDAIYPALAEAYGVHLYPFFLEGVATVPGLNQADGIHPNAAGVEVIVENITPYVIEIIEDAGLAAGSSG